MIKYLLVIITGLAVIAHLGCAILYALTLKQRAFEAEGVLTTLFLIWFIHEVRKVREFNNRIKDKQDG